MSTNLKLFLAAGLLIALGLAVFVSPFASSSPDGLETVAAEEGFADAADDHALAGSPVAGYGVEGVENDKAGTALAGLVGVLLTFGLGLGLFALIRVLRPSDDAAPHPPGGQGSTAARP